MGSDMVVALSRATVDASTLLGHNCNRPSAEGLSLTRRPGRHFAPGEHVLAGNILLPQARQTHTVLACRSAGQWGYHHGVNEQGVAVAMTEMRTHLRPERGGLQGAALVRLALERAGTALQAVDVLTDLAARHGQGQPDKETLDPAFLVADGQEAYLVEMCGPHWALQQIRSVRAVAGRCDLHQDWDRLSRGLSDVAIARGWWPADGCKLDFARAVGVEDEASANALRRWGRATLLLEQHSGQIDAAFLRRLLADHPAAGAGPLLPAAASLCRHAAAPGDVCTSASLIVQLPGAGQELPVAWWAFGPPCAGLYFPLLLVGELPVDFLTDELDPLPGCPLWRRFLHWSTQLARDPLRTVAIGDALAHLQERFEQDTRDFLAEAALLHSHAEDGALQRLAESFMQYHVECFDGLWTDLVHEQETPLRSTHAFSGMYVG